MASEEPYNKRTCEFQLFRHPEIEINSRKNPTSTGIQLQQQQKTKCSRTTNKCFSKENSMEFKKITIFQKSSKRFQKHRRKFEEFFSYKKTTTKTTQQLPNKEKQYKEKYFKKNHNKSNYPKIVSIEKKDNFKITDKNESKYRKEENDGKKTNEILFEQRKSNENENKLQFNKNENYNKFFNGTVTQSNLYECSRHGNERNSTKKIPWKAIISKKNQIRRKFDEIQKKLQILLPLLLLFNMLPFLQAGECFYFIFYFFYYIWFLYKVSRKKNVQSLSFDLGFDSFEVNSFLKHLSFTKIRKLLIMIFSNFSKCCVF